MKKEFKKPVFNGGQIEFRFENGEVLIYASKKGLEKLSSFCKRLHENPKEGHIHLEDYEVLTAESLNGVIAVFDE